MSMLARLLDKRLFRWGLLPLALAVVAVATLQPISPVTAAPTKEGGSDGAEVLTRGPIHEAFGQPTVFNPKPGMQIVKKPPAPVEELPPEEKPQGDNIAWLSGYWSWDDDKNDFLWVSGFWRALPPGRQWMPGYWNEANAQFQWVSGYWASAQQQELEIIQEAPPATLEQGAPPTAPTADHIWVPGAWVYRDYRYMWRPGYWLIAQPGWIWIPATYYWTPSGYVYVEGYWDWSIRRRGVIFAPCYFDPVVVYRPGYYYRPSIVLDVDLITPHFFCRPAYGHYYFGDYYATSYVSVGITPWFNFTYVRGGFYSGDFAYYEYHYRRADPQWSVNIRLSYERNVANPALRPARTYVQQTTIINNVTNVKNTTIINNNTQSMAMAKPLKDYSAAAAKSADSPMKFEKISETKARDYGKMAADTRKVSVERANFESNKTGAITGNKTVTGVNTTSQIKKVTLPKSPTIASMPTGDVAKTSGVGSITGHNANVPPPVPGTEMKKAGGVSTTGVTGTGRNNAMQNLSGSENTKLDSSRLPALDKAGTKLDMSKTSSGNSKNSSSGNSKSSNKDKEKGKDKP
jgi:hypothetical protein